MKYAPVSMSLSHPARQILAEVINEPEAPSLPSELEAQEFYKFFQMSTDLMMIGQMGGRILKVNQGTIDALGYTEAEFRQMLLLDIVHPDDRESTLAELHRQSKSGTSVDFENRCVCKDGSCRWLSWRARFDADTQLSYATARDVTENKRIQDELHQQQVRYSALVNNTTDVIMEFDRFHRHTYANNAVSSIGLTPEDFIGKTHEEMGFPKHLCDIWEHAIERVFLTGQPYTTYFEAENPGGLMKVDWSVFPGIVVGGKVITVLNVSRDITQYKKIEEELSRMQKLTSLGVLAGGIAHDFNNILTILFGNISLAKSFISLDHRAHTALEQAEVAFQRATHLTSQLLTFAKGGEPVVQDVSMSAVINEVVHFDLSGSNVRLEFQPPADLWQARVDKGQISQVFSNLAMNAKQAMADGGHLYITAENCLLDRSDLLGVERGKYVKFAVRDEGCGISETNLCRIFDPYFSTKKQGSGLGLATVYSIVSRHGGHIAVESTVNVGTTFTLYLPASEEAANDEAPQAEIMPDLAPGKARLLVMDDEDMIADLCHTYLSMHGYEVERARDGKEAVEMYAAAVNAGKPYDCMIMDLTIPGGMSGEVALVQIQQQYPVARAIVSSGYAADPVMANYKSHGFCGRISKPFRLAALEEEIRRVLTESSAN